jgi:nitroimidazol reductase NimA-like FMN-containing flavoprotein (pyridoxamine 5'-phosphate oxidase superfamily)
MPTSDQPASEASTPQTRNEAFWTAAPFGAGLTELDRQECLELLAAKAVGRVAYVVDNGARILPMNYVLAEDCIMFRTVGDGEIYHHALSSMCAFEVDETDEFFESGWSVVVVGRLDLASEDDFARMRYGKLPEPWAGGNRYLFVRIGLEQVSGRRVISRGR